jgi:hypothetical protein
VQFRKWAIGIIESFTTKGFAMDDERLKNDGSVFSKRYFEAGCSGRLVRICDLRATGSESNGSQGNQAVPVVLWRESARSSLRLSGVGGMQ